MVDKDKGLKKHCQPLNEFAWMWIASVFPIIFGSLFVRIKYNNIGYPYILSTSVETDTIFAYVASMLAPFWFLLAQFITAADDAKRSIKNIKYGGFLIILSVVITVVISGIFYDYKVEAKKYNYINSEQISSRVASTTTKKDPAIVDKNPQSAGEATSSKIKSNSSFSDLMLWLLGADLRCKILILCYAISILIWYYTIYLKYLGPPDIQLDENARVNGLMGVISKQTEGK